MRYHLHLLFCVLTEQYIEWEVAQQEMIKYFCTEHAMHTLLCRLNPHPALNGICRNPPLSRFKAKSLWQSRFLKLPSTKTCPWKAALVLNFIVTCSASHSITGSSRISLSIGMVCACVYKKWFPKLPLFFNKIKSIQQLTTRLQFANLFKFPVLFKLKCLLTCLKYCIKVTNIKFVSFRLLLDCPQANKNNFDEKMTFGTKM